MKLRVIAIMLLSVHSVYLPAVFAEDKMQTLREQEEIVRRSPGDIRKRNYLSLLYRKYGEPERSEELTRETLKLPGGDIAGSYEELVSSLDAQQRREDALPLANLAIKKFPHDPYLRSTRAFIWRGLHNSKAQLIDLNEAVKCLPPVDKQLKCSVFTLRAQNFMADQEWNKALEDLDAALAAQPGKANCIAMRGRCFLKLGKVKDGLSNLELALRLNPTDTDPYFYRAEYYEQNHQYARAIKDWTAIINGTHNSIHPDYFEKRMKLYELNGQNALAARDRATIKELNSIEEEAFKPLKYGPAGTH